LDITSLSHNKIYENVDLIKIYIKKGFNIRKYIPYTRIENCECLDFLLSIGNDNQRRLQHRNRHLFWVRDDKL